VEGTLLIDHVNTLLSGGAAVAARRLHQGLLQAEVGSRLWYSSRDVLPNEAELATGEGMRAAPWPLADASMAARANRIVHECFRKLQLRLLRSYYRRGRKRRGGGFVGVRQTIKTPFDPAIFDGDIVHFHWVGKLIDFPSFFESMPKERPLVWSLHDMNPMTGGCSHAGDCEGFARRCGDCPILARPGPSDLSNQELSIKHDALQGRRVFVIAPSHWMASMARKSSLFAGCSVSVIRNPIDTSGFYPEDKRLARKSLGLPEDGICLLYAAESVEVNEKGINEYLAVLRDISKSRSVFGLAFGRGEIVSQVENARIFSLGYLSLPSQMRMAYSAADIFVIPSHAETISQTTVEAFACGTPAVAFAVGGIPELVRDGETGFLASFRDVGKMSDRIGWLIDHPERRLEMGETALAVVRKEFESRHQISKYIDLYSEILEPAGTVAPARAMEKISFPSSRI
jgi:glycosyltransferase involved in cell wall biosynthesis